MDIIKRFSDKPAPRNTGVVRVLSIDLGTTNSVIAESVWVPGYPPMCKALPITQPLLTGATFTGELVPSVVAIPDNETVLIGEAARRLRHDPDRFEMVRGRNLFYETKNDMGLNRTYEGAPACLDQPFRTAAYILSFLVDAAEQGGSAPCQAVTVTVPASFQMNQRRDTLRAAQLADLHLDQDSLMEEPAAALIDYLMSDTKKLFLPPEKQTTCLIFDFGGGTCDVSVISIVNPGKNRPLSLSERSVSRYHRLGGGDIDAAIVHEVLIPSLAAEHDLKPLDLTWENRKLELEPQLAATAESLKIELCRKIQEMEDRNTYRTADKDMVRVTAPTVDCRVNGAGLSLSAPALSAAAFEDLLEPFLDIDHLYARETEYRLTQSVFSPIEDALDRAGLTAGEVDFCLITGGSVLIPQVRLALEDWFGREKVGGYEDPERMQTAVARGAAWNTIFKAITGNPLIQPVLHDGIDLITHDGSCHTLIEPGTALPWPVDGSWRRLEMTTPRTGELFVEQLRIKLVSGLDGRHLLNEIWDLPRAVCPGDDIVMEYRLTSGKQFECRAYLKTAAGEPFSRTLENPLVNVVNPGSIRLKIAETEEKLRRIKGGTREDVDDYINLAKWYAELNQHEKALHCLHVALKKNDRPHETALNLQGIYFKARKDFDRAEKSFQEARRAAGDTWSGPTFNLALLYRDMQRYDEAFDVITEGLGFATDDGAFWALAADVENRRGEKDLAVEFATDALDEFPPLEEQDDWELCWYTANARFLKDDKAVAEAETEKQRRKKAPEPEPDDDTPRPVVKGNVVPFRPVKAA